MLLYGKYLLNFDGQFDFQEKLRKINDLTFEQAQAVLSKLFNDEEKAVALVGNTDKALVL